jgi:hypothetical protein
MQDNELHISLNNYDEIFSDFDPRPYSVRALSADFLDEARRANLNSTGPIELKFFVEDGKKNLRDENVIKKRLDDHFKRHYEAFAGERRQMIKQGLGFASLGVIMMLLATFILLSGSEKTFLTAFFVVLFEPGGWFLFWEGMYMAIFESRMRKTDYAFYKRMQNFTVTFIHSK